MNGTDILLINFLQSLNLFLARIKIYTINFIFIDFLFESLNYKSFVLSFFHTHCDYTFVI